MTRNPLSHKIEVVIIRSTSRTSLEVWEQIAVEIRLLRLLSTANMTIGVSNNCYHIFEWEEKLGIPAEIGLLLLLVASNNDGSFSKRVPSQYGTNATAPICKILAYYLANNIASNSKESIMVVLGWSRWNVARRILISIIRSRRK